MIENDYVSVMYARIIEHEGIVVYFSFNFSTKDMHFV